MDAVGRNEVKHPQIALVRNFGRIVEDLTRFVQVNQLSLPHTCAPFVNEFTERSGGEIQNFDHPPFCGISVQ